MSLERAVRNVEQLKEGAMHLKLADQYVKDGHFERALAQIARARASNPGNLYALAYEERVRALLLARQQGAVEPPGAERTLVSSIEQISNLASVEAQRTLEFELRHMREAETVRAEEEIRRRLEQERREALAAKMRSLVNRIIEYQANNDLRRALDEVARAFVLDPGNEEVRLLEAQLLQQQQEAERRADEERRTRLREEEVARDRILRAEQARQEAERDELRRNAEAARRTAQQAKVREYLDRSREHLAAGRLDESLTELAFVVVLDPLNDEVLQLERSVRDEADRRQREALEQSRKREQEHTKRLEALRVTLQKHLQEAEDLAAGNEYTAALRVITRAYLLDPLNPEVQSCEDRILQAQEQAHRRAEEDRRAAEEALRRKRDEDLRRMEHAERERLERAMRDEDATRRKADQLQIREYLRKASESLTQGRFDSALGELALAFIIDPFDDEIRTLEQQVLRAREEAPHGDSPSAVPRPPTAAAMPPAPETTAAPLRPMAPADAGRERLWHALELLDQRLFDEALREVEKGLREDPASEDLLALRTRIEESARETPTAAESGPHSYAHTARELLEHGLPEEALEEIRAGLRAHPGDRALRTMESEIEARRQSAATAAAGSPESSGADDPVRARLRRAEDLARAGNFSEALDEIARAYAVNPLDDEIRRMEVLIRQAESRRMPPELDTPGR